MGMAFQGITMKRLLAAAFAAVSLLVAHTAWAQAQSVEDLPWQQGPTTGQLGSTASIKVPAGYMFLGPDGAREFNRLTENPSPGVDEYVFAKQDMSWIAFFSFDPVGYVKDDEKLDPADLLSSAKEGTEASNEERRSNGWEPIHVTGWAFQPKYDPTIKSLEWAFRLRGENSTNDSINYNTRLLGRRGVMGVLLLTSPEELDGAVADFKTRLPGYSFNSGETYAEFRDGDNVAAYGLAALVTGGAAAVAAKKGFFAVIAAFLLKGWKLILIALAGGFAVFRKMFSKEDA